MLGWRKIILGVSLFVAGCGSTPTVQKQSGQSASPSGNIASSLSQSMTPIPGKTRLPDRFYFSQTDPRWASQRLGNSSDTIETDGCLLSATAIALANLGFETDPGDLNKRLTAVNGFTNRGWLIWSAIDKVTDNQATARYFDSVRLEDIDACLADGYYPLARFILPNGRSHWAVILDRSNAGFHVRDPFHASEEPLIFPRGVDAFKAIRCVGKA